MGKDRIWERWDDPGVANEIDHYWTTDPSGYETILRSTLARLVQRYLVSPTERVLEVGCGSGLIYSTLIPEILVNSSYVGVDTSLRMTQIARKRYPAGQFIHGDIFDLQFPSNSFDVTLCFEVLGHLPQIKKPIAELFRVASRLTIFTVWTSPEDKTLTSTEQVLGSKFLYQLYSSYDIFKTIHQAVNREPHSIEVRVLSDRLWAYLIFKGPAHAKIRDSQRQGKILSFHGLTDLFIRQTVDLKNELERRETELEELRSKGKTIVHELDMFRHRRVIRWMNRIFAGSNAWQEILPAFQQLKDDSLIFNKRLKGYRLQPSINLQRVPFIHYPLDLNRPNLTGIVLAPIIDLPLRKGVIGIEIVSPSNEIVTQHVVPVDQINESVPTRFDFSPIRNSDQGRFWLRVFARNVDTPVRIFEWRKYSVFGLGQLKTKAFSGFLFKDNM